MKSNHPIDEACLMLQGRAKREGLHRIELDVYANGRVVFREVQARGSLDCTRGIARGDLHPDSSDQMPSAAFEDLGCALESER